MKKLIFLMSGLVMGFTAQAQLQTPQLSPSAKIEQTVGLTNFELNYSRPALRGRDLHKEIVPYDQPWRFGANQNTTLKFDTPIKMNGEDIKRGEYALFAIPHQDSWELVIYNDTKNWGMPEKLDDKKIVTKVKVPVVQTKVSQESFSISFEEMEANQFVFMVKWGTTALPIHVELPTKELAMESIKKTMSGAPTEADYFRASGYLLNENENLDEALKYASEAIRLNKKAPAYYYFNKAMIEHKLGNVEEAKKTAKQTLEMAKKSNFDEYVRKAERALKEW